MQETVPFPSRVGKTDKHRFGLACKYRRRADDGLRTCRLIFENKDRSKAKYETGICYSAEIICEGSIWKKTIRGLKISDAKLFLIKLLQEEGKSYSSIHTIRGVLRPAFQMAVDDDILVKNPFGFQLAGVLVNDAVTREAITKDQMRKFLKFVHDEVVYILFHIGM